MTQTRSARRGRIPKPLVRLARIAVIALAVWLLLRLLRGVDWSEVGYSLTHLAGWQIAASFAVQFVPVLVGLLAIAVWRRAQLTRSG